MKETLKTSFTATVNILTFLNPFQAKISSRYLKRKTYLDFFNINICTEPIDNIFQSRKIAQLSMSMKYFLKA